MTTFIRYLVDELSGFSQALPELFWSVADRAERTRARLKARREQCELAERESAIHRQLGMAGFGLLSEGVSVTPTPDTEVLLEDIYRLATQRNEKERQLATELSDLSSHEWRRLARDLELGSHMVQWIQVEPDAPGCGQRPTGGTPPGLCVAIKRNGTLHPTSEGLACRPGDQLFVVVPVTAISQWAAWAAGKASTSRVD
jgi:hypothetical protein